MLAFTEGIWVLYLPSRGFSLGEIGLAESAFHLAPITLELATGSLADLFGRKWSLAAGSLCAAAPAVMMLRADSLWVALPAMYVQGASYASRSGAGHAFFYDALAERGARGRFTGILGRLISASYLVVAVTTWLGAWPADRSFALPYLLSIGAGLGGALLAVGLREPERERVAHRSVVRAIGEGLAIVRGRVGLPLLLVYGAAWETLVALVALYAQAVLAGRGLAPSRVGLVIGATLICTAAGAWFADRVTARGGFAGRTIVAAVATAGAGLGLGSGVLALAVAPYLVAEFFAGVYESVMANRINAAIGPAQRATILSVQGFLYSITMVWACPVFGALAGRAGWLAAYAAASGIVGALLLLWLGGERRRRGSRVAPHP